MRSQDQKVKAAKELLELLLRDVFVETSTACRNRLEELGDPLVVGQGIFGGLGTEGDYVVRDFIKLWKEGLAGCITKVFKSFVAAREPQADETNPGVTAKQLTWETIDQVFHWTPDDRSSSTWVKEWLSRAAYPEPPSVLGTLPPEYGWQAQTADQLNRDFCTQFEGLLNQLMLETFVNTPTPQSTNTLVEGASQAHSTDGTGPAEKLQEQVAASNLLHFNGNLWVVRFEGGNMSHIEDLVGLQYIALVLQQKLAEQPNMTPAELVNLRHGREATPELERRDEVLPLTDTETIQERIDEIDAILQSGTATKTEVLLDAKTKLEKYRASGRAKLPGADRPYRQAHFPDNTKRALDAVRKTIKQATDKMEADKALTSLAAHLHANIRFGTTVSYAASIAWTVEPGTFPRKKS